MGQFEIKGTKTMELIPDTISLIISAVIESKNVVSNDKTVEDAKSKLKDTVTKLVCDLEAISKDCNVSFSNLIYNESQVTNMFEQSSKSFGAGRKKQEPLVNVKASTNITIKLATRDEDVLSSILKSLLNSTAIVGIYDNLTVSDIENKYTELKAEVCKKCRKDADIIVTSLGSSILGVEKVVYNSGGSLLDSQSNKTAKTASIQAFNSFDDGFEYDCSDFGDLVEQEDLDEQKYDDVWAKGFVKTILDKKYTISDSVTVVFNIK